jgi:hypothetical protein
VRDDADEKVTTALDAYATALHSVRPSQQLDARIHAAIAREMSRAQARSSLWRKPMWALAAGAAAIAIIASVLLLARESDELVLTDVWIARENLPPPALPEGSLAVLPAGGISLWPTEATVFRVRGPLDAVGSMLPPSIEVDPEQQYWFDVRMANDGSMRIERVLSADGSELFAHPDIHY